MSTGAQSTQVMIASRSGLSPPLRSSLVQLHRAGCTIGLWLSAWVCRLVKPVLRIDVRLLACSFKGCLLLLRGPLTLRPSRMVIAEPHEVTMALGLHVVGRQAREDETWRWYICNRGGELRRGKSSSRARRHAVTPTLTLEQSRRPQPLLSRVRFLPRRGFFDRFEIAVRLCSILGHQQRLTMSTSLVDEDVSHEV